MTTSNLVVPMVLWGKTAPTHCVASVLMTRDQQRVVTGCNDGQICVWDVGDNYKTEPYRMLFGHSAAVTCLCIGSNHPEKNYVVSSSDNGEMCLWDLQDGRCVEHTKFPYTHTGVQAYQLLHARDVRLICNGYYPEIHVMHPLSLEVLFSLHSRIQPDWISALCILRPVKREDDVVLAISNSGTVKVWTMTGNEGKSSQPIYEDEAKQIRCLNAHTLRCCAYNQRTVLIVCPKYWQIYDTNYVERERPVGDADGIYDAGDFSLLCSESARRGERWMGGEFIALDRVAVWSSDGRGYLYKLPTNPDYRRMSNPNNPTQEGPQAYNVLDLYLEKPLSCCPAMMYVLGRRGRECKLLLRGDSDGRIAVWTIPDVHDNKMKLVRQESFEKLPVVQPTMVTTMAEEWRNVNPLPEGLIDHLNVLDGKMLQITSTIYIPTQGRLVCGREDGSIVIVPAVHAMLLLLLSTTKTKDSLQRQVLQGHAGRVNCLLYPLNDSPRYDPNHLVSGGMDFTVVLWDLSSGAKLHTFSVHGGEILQLLVPPENCNPRVLPCVCAVASDHSLSLLSLKERKSILLAARQLFPIHTVKWRPLDDFLVIGCTDGTVYVWQMETGHLDRVAHGVTAEDILHACGQRQIVTTDVTNPHISLTQALKRRNLATFRNMAQQKMQQVQDLQHKHDHASPHMHLLHRADAHPMLIQGLRTNTKDADAHVVFFDIESLIIQLLSEEYALMSPGTLEAHGLASHRDGVAADHAGDPHRKLAGFIAKVKDKAENVGHKIQEKAESAGIMPPLHQRRADEKQGKSDKPKNLGVSATSLTMEIARFFMSALHAWGQDLDLDKLALNKLGLVKPVQPLTFGVLSRGGHMSLLLPGWNKRFPRVQVKSSVPRDVAERLTEMHWRISTALTTQHLVSIISVANTLMSMSSSAFTVEASALQRVSETGGDETLQQSHIKQGWSLLATLHCVLLPDLLGKARYLQPQLEMLARRWQDRCLEIREAAQALFLAELRRIGPDGRKSIVDDWSPYLPSYVDPAMSLLQEHQQTQGSHAAQDTQDDDIDEEDQILGGDTSDYRLSITFESRRKQATAIVMMGVLGAEFGQEMGGGGGPGGGVEERKHQQHVVKGFGITDYSHARHTSKALTFLLLTPPSQRLPAFSPLRRAAIDLIGRGFSIWEPYLDVSAILLGLLELCVDGDKLVPSLTFGLPLTPQADACRTARHALGLIATAKPATFITTMAKEVARYNAMAQNAQTPHAQLSNSVLVRAKSEILRVLESLVDKIPNDVVAYLVDVMDITVFCIDVTQVKQRGLQDVFPSICRYSMVSYCGSTRRICVGAAHGGIAFYELKQAKCQVLPAHKGAVTAIAFSPDGKFLASYGIGDNKLCFWQTASTSLFGIGSQQTKCVRTFATPPVAPPPNTNLLKLARLIWVDPRTVVLLTVDGTESKFRV